MSGNKNQKEPVLLQRQDIIDAHEENIKRTYAKVRRQGHATERDLDNLGYSIHQLVLLEGGDTDGKNVTR